MRTLISTLCFLVLCAGAMSGPAWAAELLMLEEEGCGWCEQWNEEIGGIYHKTQEGMRAPLRRHNIHDPLPSDLAFVVKGGYTPTFVLVDQGREIGRIRGYPGNDFFWGLLQQLLKRLPNRSDQAGGNN